MEMGTIIAWHKAEGEEVAVGDALYEVENEKSVIAVEAMAPGLLAKIIAPASAEVRVGEAVAVNGRGGKHADLFEDRRTPGRGVGWRCAVRRVTPRPAWRRGRNPREGKHPQTSALAPCPRLGPWPRASEWTWLRCRGPVGRGSSPPMMWKQPRPRRALPDPRSGSGVPWRGYPRAMAAAMARNWTEIPHFSQTLLVSAAPLMASLKSQRAGGKADLPQRSDGRSGGEGLSRGSGSERRPLG